MHIEQVNSSHRRDRPHFLGIQKVTAQCGVTGLLLKSHDLFFQFSQWTSVVEIFVVVHVMSL